MRGRMLHNYLAARAIAILIQLDCIVTTEKRFRAGSTITDVDLWATRHGVSCAIEIETTWRSAIRNIAKMHAVPCDAYVVLLPHRPLAAKVEGALRNAEVRAIRPPLISTLASLPQRLTTVFHGRFLPPESGNQKNRKEPAHDNQLEARAARYRMGLRDLVADPMVPRPGRRIPSLAAGPLDARGGGDQPRRRVHPADPSGDLRVGWGLERQVPSLTHKPPINGGMSR